MRTVLKAAVEAEGPRFLTPDGPGIVVPIMYLAVLDALADEVGELLVAGYRNAQCCLECGGNILAPTRGGVPRGSCHCTHNMARDF